MRILYYSPHPHLNLSDPAGYGTHMREMIAAFRDLGHEVHPVIMGGTEPRPSAPVRPLSLVKRIARRIIPARRWQTLKDQQLIRFDHQAEQKLLEEIKRFQPDFIYERGNYLQVSGVRAARATSTVHIVEMNSPYTEEKKELEGDSRLLSQAHDRERELLKKTHHIVTVSSSLRDYFVTKHHLNAQRFTILPNAIDPEKIRVTPDALASVRDRYDLEGKTVIGWVGSIQPWHGIDTMIDAFAQLPARERAGARLLNVGGGETLEEMKERARFGEAANEIIFTGSVPHREVFAHIAAMDICLLPNTKWYCSPIKIFEYGAMGKAIVASRHAAVLDVMEPDLDGLIIPPSASALHNALLKLMPKPELRARYAQQFREKVLTEHTWAANAHRVLDLLPQLQERQSIRNSIKVGTPNKG